MEGVVGNNQHLPSFHYRGIKQEPLIVVDKTPSVDQVEIKRIFISPGPSAKTSTVTEL
jgi:hypothetical protein